MFKNLLIVFALLFLHTATQATDVSGVITTNTTWTKANSPYILTGHLIIDSATTLTVEPGVTVKANGWYRFLVDGRLIAMGTQSDHIFFTSNISMEKNAWAGIEFRKPAANDSSMLRYCTVQYAQTGVAIQASYVNVSNCDMLYNLTGISTHSSSKQTPSITNSNISWNETGISGFSQYGGQISSNTIAYNKTGFYISQSSACIISNNQILFNSDGIRIVNGANPCPPLIGNSILSNKTGINSGGEQVTFDSMAFNLIEYNETGFLMGQIIGKVNYNTITNNKRGIQNSYYRNTGYGTIENNCIYNNTEYDFVNDCPDKYLLANNYWGTTDTALITVKILDFYDNILNGKTFILPFASSPNTSCKTIVQPTAITQQNKAITSLKAYPNPANDVVHLEFTNTPSELSVSITDLTGKTIFTTPFTTQKLEINVQQWPAGMYIVRYQGDGTSGVAKFVKE